MTATAVKIIGPEQLREWHASSPTLSAPIKSLGRGRVDSDYVSDLLGRPYHLQFVVERLAEERGEVPAGALDSIPFFSLCHGLFLPLSGLSPQRAAQVFGLATPEPPGTSGREELLRKFIARDAGLSLRQKLACILGDPFEGRRATLKRDSLLSLLQTMTIASRKALLDRLPAAGEVAVLFAEERKRLHESPPLTASEVLETLRQVPGQGRKVQFRLLRSLLERSGKLEAYFIARLVLRKAGFGFDYQGPLLSKCLAEPWSADPGAVAHAIALTSAFHVARVLEEEGLDGLRKIQLQPLVPVRPALAVQGEGKPRYPAWVERKYDGIRFMLHKSADAGGSVLCGAYTRNRNDWLEMVRGLDASIRMLPCRSAIIDGELHGTVVDIDHARPASVYDVHTTLQGTRVPPAAIKFAAFDILYIDGRDLTSLPLHERRRILATLLAPLQAFPLPVPIQLAEGQVAQGQEDANRLYGHFRAQGHEGIVLKDPNGPYRLGERDASWVKRKPEVTLDLVLLGATHAVTTKENVGIFGSYVIGARDKDGWFKDVGDVAGIDKEREAQIRQEIVADGVLTGRRIERPSSSGTRPGLEFRPEIVVTVRFEGVVRDNVTKELSLRDPKLVAIRSDKRATEADTVQEIEELYLKQRMS